MLLNKNLFLMLIILIVSFSCSSMKKAKDLMENGNYEQARVILVKVLKKDPNNKKALTQKEVCESKIINRKLIAIRNARIAGTSKRALDLANNVLLLQDEWNYKLDVNSSSFFNSEMNYLFPWFKKAIRANIKANHILLSEYNLKHYQRLFGMSMNNDVAKLKKLIRSAGKIKCKWMLKKSRNKYFFSSFVNQYCKYFKIRKKSKYSAAKMPTDLLKMVNVTLVTSSNIIKSKYSSKIKSSLKTAFHKSPWYVPRAKRSTNLNVNINYSYNINTTIIPKVHEYTDKEPYETVEQVEKVRKAPYTAAVTKCEATKADPLKKECKTVTVIKYREEKYKESQKTIKYRDVTKYYKYYGKQHEQNISMSQVAEFQLFKKEGLVLNNSLSKDEFSHEISMPKMNLTPITPSLIKPHPWTKDQIAQFSAMWLQKLNDIWTRRFCKNSNNAGESLIKASEHVMRCMRAGNYASSLFVKSWHIKFTGIDSLKSEKLLGRYY